MSNARTVTDNAVTNGVSNGTPSRPVPTRPDPAYKGRVRLTSPSHLRNTPKSKYRLFGACGDWTWK